MALANVAWVLASHGKRVLVIDWDLEAPGLHRYFRPFLIDGELLSTEGLIDYVWTLSCEALASPSANTRVDANQLAADIDSYITRLNWEFGPNAYIDFIPAGRQGDVYAERVNAFDWVNFYERLHGGAFLNRMRLRIQEEYDYVLIDSRTGVSDTSGICTVQMPDAVVVLFTLNNQSVHGAEAVASSIREQRAELKIYPVCTRIDDAEQDKLNARLRLVRDLFNPFLDHLDETDRSKYWGDIEYRYVPYYAYEEILAPFADSRGRNATLLATSRRLAQYLTEEPISEVPWITESKRQPILAAYSRSTVENLSATSSGDQAMVVELREIHAGRDFAHTGKSLEAAFDRTHKTATGTVAGETDLRDLRAGRDSIPAPKLSDVALRFVSPTKVGWLAAAGVVTVALVFLITKLFGLATLSGEQEQLARLYDENAPPGVRAAAFLYFYESGQRDFADAILDSADLAQLTLPRGDFNLRHVNLRNARLRDAKLRGAVLDSADLRGSDLSRADLTGASLIGSRLGGATLDSTILDGANLTHSSLEGTSLESASTNSRTVLTDGTPGPYRTDEDISLLSVVEDTSASGERGYIWIGNYDRRSGRWEKVLLARSGEEVVGMDPARLSESEEFVVLGNLNLRRDLPRNDSAYFQSVVSLGVLPQGSTVALLGTPSGINRKGIMQFWAYVRVVESERPTLETPRLDSRVQELLRLRQSR